VSLAKTAEPIEMPFWETTHVSPRKMCLMGSISDESIRIRDGWQVGDATFCHIIFDTRYYYYRTAHDKVNRIQAAQNS